MERIDRYSAQVHGRLELFRDSEPREKLLKPPGTPGAEKNYTTRVLQRDRLQACLLEEIAEAYPQVEVRHGIACEGVELLGDKPSLRLREAESVVPDGDFEHGPVDLVVGADGVRSAVRDALATAPFSQTELVRYANNNERRYKTFPMHPSNVPGTRGDLNWGTSNSTVQLAVDALPTMEGQMVGVLLFRPETPIYKRIEDLKTAADARKLFEDALPQLLPFVEDEELGRFAARPIGRLPSFQLVRGDIHRPLPKGGVLLLGDSIKAVKPYFGQGCNSALEDVTVLGRCLEEAQDSPREAATRFSHSRAEDARALVRISRSFDHPGPLGIARFVAPLILDSVLHRTLPRVFSPPLLRALQNEKYSFAFLERRKRWERLFQVGLLAGLVALVCVLPTAARAVYRRILL